MRSIAHLNIIGFRAAVASLEDKSLIGRPYIIAGETGGRVVAWDVSPAAIKQNIKPGMPLASAQRISDDLIVVQPNPQSYQKANGILETVIKRFAPAWQNDGVGNLFLDITGTRNLFGAPADCMCRVQNEIQDSLGINAAAACASNKLVSKVASRAIRPAGLIDVRHGDEESFLAHQDITLLPGLGRSLMKTIRITGFREAWELAVLSDSEAISLFGKNGPLLRDSAKGIDNTPVLPGGIRRTIERSADFFEDVLDDMMISGALACLAEHAGLEMRNDKLGMTDVRLTVTYADGIEAQGIEKSKHVLVTDKDIFLASSKLYKKIINRRIRIRRIFLCLENPSPLGYEPDLFEPETETKNRSLQEAVDKIQNRFGAGKVMQGIILAADRGRENALCAIN